MNFQNLIFVKRSSDQDYKPWGDLTDARQEEGDSSSRILCEIEGTVHPGGLVGVEGPCQGQTRWNDGHDVYVWNVENKVYNLWIKEMGVVEADQSRQEEIELE